MAVQRNTLSGIKISANPAAGQVGAHCRRNSDSTGAVAGNILGVMNGEKAIPEKWRRNLREYSIVSQISDDLHQRIALDDDGHVTQEWWDLYPGA